MSLALLLVIAAIISFVVIGWVARTRLQFSNATSIQLVDLESFRNLADPRESQYLRDHLPGAEFRRIQRVRLRAMAVYLRALGSNAVVLIRVGQAALSSNQKQTREAALKLVDEALLLRRNAALAMLRVYLALLWPGPHCPATPVVEGYERLSGSAMLLGRLQNPGATVRISA